MNLFSFSAFSSNIQRATAAKDAKIFAKREKLGQRWETNTHTHTNTHTRTRRWKIINAVDRSAVSGWGVHNFLCQRICKMLLLLLSPSLSLSLTLSPSLFLSRFPLWSRTTLFLAIFNAFSTSISLIFDFIVSLVFLSFLFFSFFFADIFVTIFSFLPSKRGVATAVTNFYTALLSSFRRSLIIIFICCCD